MSSILPRSQRASRSRPRGEVIDDPVEGNGRRGAGPRPHSGGDAGHADAGDGSRRPPHRYRFRPRPAPIHSVGALEERILSQETGGDRSARPSPRCRARAVCRRLAAPSRIARSSFFARCCAHGWMTICRDHRLEKLVKVEIERVARGGEDRAAGVGRKPGGSDARFCSFTRGINEGAVSGTLFRGFTPNPANAPPRATRYARR